MKGKDIKILGYDREGISPEVTLESGCSLACGFRCRCRPKSSLVPR